MHKIATMQLICRRIIGARTINKQNLYTSIRLWSTNDSSSSSDSSSDSDTEQNVRKNVENKAVDGRKDESKQQTIDLLNNLLTRMSEETLKTKTFRAAPKRSKRPKPLVKLNLEDKIVTAAKETADALGGDTEKTRIELLNKALLSVRKPPEVKEEKKVEDESKKVVDEQPTPSFSQLLAQMKIDTTKRVKSIDDDPFMASKEARIQQISKKLRERRDMYIRGPRTETMPGNLYSPTESLNIFKPSEKAAAADPDTPKMEIWNYLEKKEMKLLLTHPPENAFQEMIQWTERGLLWQFPINNDFGREEEENVHFSEHVFMEPHIHEWCPKKGPVRHFMELVCVGLSKNPYMTVQEKIEHLDWYKCFFAERQDMLKEIGAIDKLILPRAKGNEEANA